MKLVSLLYCIIVILNFRFKDDQSCSNLIAEALDADGNISSLQVVNKLKELGLKVPKNKRIRHDDGEAASPNSNDPLQSLWRQPL